MTSLYPCEAEVGSGVGRVSLQAPCVVPSLSCAGAGLGSSYATGSGPRKAHRFMSWM